MHCGSCISQVVLHVAVRIEVCGTLTSIGPSKICVWVGFVGGGGWVGWGESISHQHDNEKYVSSLSHLISSNINTEFWNLHYLFACTSPLLSKYWWHWSNLIIITTFRKTKLYETYKKKQSIWKEYACMYVCMELTSARNFRASLPGISRSASIRSIQNILKIKPSKLSYLIPM